MTREECEAKIFEKLLEIEKIYNQYNPEGKYLTLCINSVEYFFNNCYWEDDMKHKISVRKRK